MGTHLVLERLSCNATAASSKGEYVRVVLNEAVVPFDSCQSGPGFSCSLHNYTSLMGSILPNFIETCKIPASYPQYLKFWWDYNTTTSLNYQNGSIGYQGAL
jgi:acid phosphatase